MAPINELTTATALNIVTDTQRTQRNGNLFLLGRY